PSAALGTSTSSMSTTSSMSEDQNYLWHARIGHVSPSSLKQVAKATIVPESFKLALSAPRPGPCEPCLEGKQTRLPYPLVDHQPTEPLEIVHTDTCNIPVKSLKGFKDFVTFTDGFTHYFHVYYLLNKKPETLLDVFKHYQAAVETHFHSAGHTIKSIHMDGGSEYKAALTDYLVEKGIEINPTTHYSPESNGGAECLNCTLLDMAHSMLFKIG